MLSKPEVQKLLDAATDYALCILGHPAGTEVVTEDAALAHAQAFGLRTDIEAQTVLALALVMIERRGPEIRANQQAYVEAYHRRPDDEGMLH